MPFKLSDLMDIYLSAVPGAIILLFIAIIISIRKSYIEANLKKKELKELAHKLKDKYPKLSEESLIETAYDMVQREKYIKEVKEKYIEP